MTLGIWRSSSSSCKLSLTTGMENTRSPSYRASMGRMLWQAYTTLMECSGSFPSPPPAPIIPSSQTMPLTPPAPPPSHLRPSVSALSCALPPVPLPGPLQTPPPLGWAEPGVPAKYKTHGYTAV
ncbi:survival motor neuron protein-like [Clarias gariepinus]|uniref:survival motor neuron protein-like n=1 Tax=Clarias gariepinus TaxID=13013 RepID=UPI00234DB2C5|nr:survival motor neuron protein-like [Clarias gariepinus]